MNRDSRSFIEKCIVAFLKPPYLIISFVVKSFYRIFFAWWLDDRLVKSSNRGLASDIKRYVPFLFSEYGAKIVPNTIEPPPMFDFALVTLSVQGLIFRFFRDRGSITLRVASDRVPNEWHEISAVLSAMDVGVERGRAAHLLDIERILRSHMQDLVAALSSREYPQTKDRLAAIYSHDEAIRRQWETEINRRLYE